MTEWTPMQWPGAWKEPSALELLKDTAVNCLLMQQGSELGAVAERAAKEGFKITEAGSRPSGVTVADGEWPGVKLTESGAADRASAGPTGVPWIDSNGWRIRLTAALHPDGVRAAASFHGGGLVTDAPDSPHRLAGRVKASLYLGVADEDRGCTPEHQGALAAALGAADVAYCIELYRGKKHGFAVSDHPGAYDEAAAARHWRRLESFFGETLG